MKSLRGQLLISSSGLFDPNFRHTVVLIGQHTAEGALGVVLNRPTDTPVSEVIPALSELVRPDELLFHGGPVELGSPVLVAEMTDPAVADIPVFGPVGFLTGEVSEEQRAGIVRARVFVGYSGWDSGQLEAEMAHDSWVLDPARIEDVFSGDPEQLWHEVLRRKGGDYRMMARVPFDPTMN